MCNKVTICRKFKLFSVKYSNAVNHKWDYSCLKADSAAQCSLMVYPKLKGFEMFWYFNENKVTLSHNVAEYNV